MPSKQVNIWLRGLAAAFIGGGAGAVSTGISVPLVLPEINYAHHGVKILGLMAVSFIVSGTFATCGYLKQSPLPPIADDAPQTKAQGAAAGGK